MREPNLASLELNSGLWAYDDDDDDASVWLSRICMALGVTIWYSQVDRSLIKLMIYGKKENLCAVKTERSLSGPSFFLGI